MILTNEKVRPIFEMIDRRLRTFAPIKFNIGNIRFVVFDSIFNIDIDLDKLNDKLKNIKNYYKVIIIDNVCLIEIFACVLPPLSSTNPDAACIIQKNYNSESNDINDIITIIEMIDKKKKDEIKGKIFTFTSETA